MRKQVVIVVLALILAAIGLVAWTAGRTKDPVYQGKQLSKWLEAFGFGEPYKTLRMIEESDRKKQAAEDAVRAIGTNAIPMLLGMVRAHDSNFGIQLKRALVKLHLMKLAPLGGLEKHIRAIEAFRALGPRAEPAVPELLCIYTNSPFFDSRFAAVGALQAVGPAAREAVPTLLRQATNNKTPPGVQMTALYALADICQEPALIVPALSNGLFAPNPEARSAAADILGRMRSGAQSTLPALLVLLSDGALNVRHMATNAVIRIDPGVASRAGVNTNVPGL